MTHAEILIVEDESIIALDVKNILESLTYKVIDIVNSGNDCIKAVNKKIPDLILMDIKLNGEMDGIQTASTLRKKFDIPVIFITSHSDKATIASAKFTEPYGYIVKPVNEQELFTTIETSLYKYKIDKRLKEKEIKYRTLFEQSIDPIYLGDAHGNIISVNQSLMNLFGYDREEITYMNIKKLFFNSNEHESFLLKLDKNGFIENFEASIKKKDNSIIFCLISSTKLYDDIGNFLGYQGILRDITEKKMTLEELIQSREELRKLSEHLQSLRETERTDIAREIHDVLGQSLTALKMDFYWLLKRIEQKPEYIDKTESMLQLIDNIIETVRRISSELRPGVLDDLGLCAALEWLSEKFEERTGIKCDFNYTHKHEVNEKISIVIFRIVQEAFTNIIRHANATSVSIDLFDDQENLILQLHDNGTGITDEQVNASDSFGLLGIRERAYSCSGDVLIQGDSKHGTTIEVTIPVTEEIN